MNSTRKWKYPSRDNSGKKTRLYECWSTMKGRCNPKKIDSNHRLYRENNIKICDSWKSFDNFVEWSLKNGYKNNLTLDRIDVLKDYCPENCRWITLKENISRANEYHKIRWIKVIDIENNIIFDSVSKAALFYNVPSSTLRDYLNGKTKYNEKFKNLKYLNKKGDVNE